MKILADECVYKITIDFLKKHGFQIITVKDVGLKGHSDDKILKYAYTHKLISLSNDKDFSNIFKFNYKKYPGIIRLKMTSSTADEVHNILIGFLQGKTEKNLKAKLVIIDKNKYRIK